MRTGDARKAAVSLVLACACAPVLAQRIEFTPEGDFSEAAVRRGVKATQAQCDAVPNGLWAADRDGGECLKYWSAGMEPLAARRVVVFLHGDVWVGPGNTSKGYLNATNGTLQRFADEWAKRLEVPFVFIGRPGTHGSSGDHMQRRRPAESRLVSAALDVMKARYGIEEFVIAGQSGGGHVTASLLTLRGDIVCAVPTSAPSSPSVRWKMRGWKRDSTGYEDSYEPAQYLDKARMHTALRVFVVGDPQDTNVVWPSQTILAERLKQVGVPTEVIEAQGTGPELHGLPNSARNVAGWCA
ncbi:MAG TPA: hypothetical protein VFH35_01980, partial [Ramlibacter sp.]|nr:hypothetical protein [Ramlibacter sp.]